MRVLVALALLALTATVPFASSIPAAGAAFTTTDTDCRLRNLGLAPACTEAKHTVTMDFVTCSGPTCLFTTTVLAEGKGGGTRATTDIYSCVEQVGCWDRIQCSQKAFFGNSPRCNWGANLGWNVPTNTCVDTWFSTLVVENAVRVAYLHTNAATAEAFAETPLRICRGPGSFATVAPP